jgi:hypothetical protein
MLGKRVAQGFCFTAASALTLTGAANAMAPFSKRDFPTLNGRLAPFGYAPACQDDSRDPDAPDDSTDTGTDNGGETSTDTGTGTDTGSGTDNGSGTETSTGTGTSTNTSTTSVSFTEPGFDGSSGFRFGPSDFGVIDAVQPLDGSGGGAEVILADCGDPVQFGGPGAREAATEAIVGAIRQGERFCSWVPAGVRVDCVADQLREIASGLPRGGDYAPVRRALRDASRELSSIANANRARGIPERRYGAQPPEGGPVITSGRLTEIAPDRIAAANAAAAQVIEETQTVLLRSTENSRARMAAYQDISAALDSTKVLLRST